MNNETVNNTILKVQKLLKLSKSCNQAEAELAFSKAKALAEKYDLDLEMAAILGEDVEREPFDEQDVAKVGRLPVIHKYIVHLIQEFFKVSVIYSYGYRGTTISFIGRRNDIVIAKGVYEQLLTTFDWLWKNYKKQNDLPNSMKGSYMFGLKDGLWSKLNDARKETFQNKILELPEEIRDSSKGKLELALIDEKKQLRNEVTNRHPRLRTHSHNYSGGHRADVYGDGVRAGRSINTNNSLSLRG